MEKAKRWAAFPTAAWKSTRHFSTAPPAPAAIEYDDLRKGYAPWLESCIWYHDEATPKQEGQDQGASEDYSESCAEIQVFRLRGRTVGGNERRDGSAGGDLSAAEQSADLFWLRVRRSRLRHAGSTAVRVCTAVGHRGVFHLSNEAGRLWGLWCEGGIGSMGGGEAHVDARVYAVFGRLGE